MEKDCRVRGLHTEDAMCRSRWRKQIGTMSVVGECFFWYRLTRVVPDNFHRAVKRLCYLPQVDVARAAVAAAAAVESDASPIPPKVYPWGYLPRSTVHGI